MGLSLILMDEYRSILFMSSREIYVLFSDPLEIGFKVGSRNLSCVCCEVRPRHELGELVFATAVSTGHVERGRSLSDCGQLRPPHRPHLRYHAGLVEARRACLEPESAPSMIMATQRFA